jgi:hypothetical protein
LKQRLYCTRNNKEGGTRRKSMEKYFRSVRKGDMEMVGIWGYGDMGI